MNTAISALKAWLIMAAIAYETCSNLHEFGLRINEQRKRYKLYMSESEAWNESLAEW